MSLKIEGFFGFDNQIVYAHLLDHSHHFLPRSRANREHGDHRCDPEDHAQHGQQGAKSMEKKVL
jgi:hypothetical protein